MNSKIKKLENLVRTHLSKSRLDIKMLWGKPLQDSDNNTWYFKKVRYGIFKDEIAFIFLNDRVVDIMISEYVFGVHICNIFYNEGHTVKYRVVKMF